MFDKAMKVEVCRRGIETLDLSENEKKRLRSILKTDEELAISIYESKVIKNE